MKKYMKKIISFALTFMMVFAMAVTVKAEDTTYTITVNGAEGHTYEAYQIFSGKLSGGKLTDIIWGNGITETGKTELGEAKTYAEALSKLEDNSADIDAKAKELAKYLQNPSTSTYADEKYTISGLTAGYYLVKDKDGTQKDKENSSYTKYILKVVSNQELEPKSKTPTSEKKVIDTNDSTGNTSDWQDSADHDIGDEISYQIKATLHDKVSDYKHYYLSYVDTMSKGLTYVENSAVVKVNGTEVGKLEPTSVAYSGNEDKYVGGTVLTWSITDVKAAPYRAGNNDVVTIEYKAKLNDDAVIGSAGNPNMMHIEYSNNPNYTGEGKPDDTGKTPDDTNIVFTYKTVINKVDQNKKPLTGATFTLEKYNNETGDWEAKDVITNDEGTTFTFKGLDDGNYRIKETPPEGYNGIADIYFTITAEHDVISPDPKLTKLSGDVTEGTATFEPSLSDGALTTTIENREGSTLPSTGGIGTTIFYVLGTILVLGAGILLISKKRMSNQ